MLNTVTPLPDLLSFSRLLRIAVFVPELHGDFVGGEGEELFAGVGCWFSISGRGRGGNRGGGRGFGGMTWGGGGVTGGGSRARAAIFGLGRRGWRRGR